MFELKILAANILLPIAILTCTLWGLRIVALRNRFPQPTGLQLATSLLILSSMLALWLALVLRVEVARAWWPEDAWARVPVAFCIVGLASIVSVWISIKPIFWTVRAVGLLLAAIAIIPRGEAWEFLRPMIGIWVAVLVISSFLGWLLIERLPGKSAGVLGLGWIACVAAAAFLSKDFMRVTEPLLAVACILGCASLATLRTGRTNLIDGVAGPCLFGSGAIVASAQFNSFAGLPDALSWLAISSPAIAALATFVVPNKRMDDKAPGRRSSTLIIIACATVAVSVVLWTIIASGGLSTEEAWS